MGKYQIKIVMVYWKFSYFYSQKIIDEIYIWNPKIFLENWNYSGIYKVLFNSIKDDYGVGACINSKNIFEVLAVKYRIISNLNWQIVD